MLLAFLYVLSFFCVCYVPDLVRALTGIRMNSVSWWHHLFPRRHSQEGRARVDPGFVNADAILPLYVFIIYLCILVTKYILNSTELKATQNIKLYNFVHAILSVPFCPIPFCPYHFVQYHFVRNHF